MLDAKGMLSFLGGILLVSCNSSSPQLFSISPQVRHVFDPVARSYYDELSLLLLAEDEDGSADISDIFVIHDEAQLFWHFESSEWYRFDDRREDEIILPRISTSAGGSLPEGRFRVLVQDRSGKQDERAFSLARSEKNYRNFIPTLEKGAGNTLTLRSSFTVNYLFVLNGNVPVVQSTEAPGVVDYTIQEPLYVGARYKNRFYVSGPYR